MDNDLCQANCDLVYLLKPQRNTEFLRVSPCPCVPVVQTVPFTVPHSINPKKKKPLPKGSGLHASFNIYLLPEHVDAVEHFSSLVQDGYGQFFGSQFLGSQFFGSQFLGSQFFTSQELSFLHSILAFFLAFFLPPSVDAMDGKDNKMAASIATSNFFILRNLINK